MIRSLLLINPPQHQLLEGFPGSLIPLACYVAGRATGVTVSLCDLGRLPSESLKSTIAATLAPLPQPVLIGITTTTASYQRALTVAREVRRQAADAFIVLGGHHATPQDEVVLRHHPEIINGVLRGEGESALLALVQEAPRLDRVPNLTWLDHGTVRRNRSGPLLNQVELDSLAVTFHEEQIHTAPGKFHTVTYVSARGCPLSCHFCSVANEQIRAKSIPKVLEDIRFLVNERGFERIALEDNFFAANRRRTLAICEAIERLQPKLSHRFTWDCQTRVESIRDREVLTAMERAGCEAVYLGVESLIPEHLRYLGKTVDPERYLSLLEDEVVPRLLASTVDCYINVQLGLPGETPSQHQTTIETLSRLGEQARALGRRLTIFPQLHVVYPGTRHFTDAVTSARFGLHSASVFEPFTEWEMTQQPVLTWLGEHFAHGTGGIPEGILGPGALRRGDFVVEPERVEAISDCLSRIEALPGITVFRYKDFLAEASEMPPGQSGGAAA